MSSSPVHRVGDLRACGATTIASVPRNVFVNGIPIALTGDTNSHTGGVLVARTNKVFVNTAYAVVGVSPAGTGGADGGFDTIFGSPTPPDDHATSDPSSGSPNVFIGLGS